MNFLKTIFWIILAVIVVVFSLRNWTPVTINLWGGLQVDTFLPLPVIIAFFMGLVPYAILHRATRWSMQRRLANSERALAETRAAATNRPVVVTPPATPPSPPPPPSSPPMAVPPAV